jgi:hypothetical protein
MPGQYGTFEPTPTPAPMPVPGGEWIGNAVPIRIGFVATWETALNFVYVISHNRNPFELDSWELKAALGGKIQTDVTVMPMAWIKLMDIFYAPPGTTATAMAAAPPPAPGSPPVPAPPAAPPAAPPPRLGVRGTPLPEGL